MRVTHTFDFGNIKAIKKALLAFSRPFKHVVFLDSNEHQDPYASFECICAFGAHRILRTNTKTAFNELKEFKEQQNDWLFGYLSYDLKNELEELTSDNYDGLGFDQLIFFVPEKIIRVTGNSVDFMYLERFKSDIPTDFQAIRSMASTKCVVPKHLHGITPKIKLRVHRDAYLEKLHSVLRRIQRGDIYEVNICQEFYAENAVILPQDTFWQLTKISKAPFACFLKMDEKYLLGSSPERYLKKIGNKLISQPIKGTAPRSSDPSQDLNLKVALAEDPKERSENIMIVDLVRNDLSKHAIQGSVQVEELCKVYSFEQVHQMISTVSASVCNDVDAIDLIRSSFPMGSMTGAPKVEAMKIIEATEESKRSLYSGAVGYFTPEGDFDFNVVIRSILYNATKNYVSFTVGSAITAKANPQKEYQECLLKAKAMRDVLESALDD